MKYALAFPPGTETFDHFARELIALLGWTAPEDTLIAEDARVLGKALADGWQQLDDAGKENFVQLASQLLAEWETRLGAPVSPGSSDADRQAALTAKRRATGGNTRGRVLAAAQVFDASASIITTSAQDAADSLDPRLVFSWAIAVDVATYEALGEILSAIMQQMKPAHTECNLGTLGDGGVFRFDDPDSVFDRTLFGG